MTSQQEKCGLSSLLSMSCRQRTEAFAQSLRSRLTSLDSEEKSDPANENGWLSTKGNLLAVAQPKHSSESNFSTDFYLNFVSPGSPAVETNDSEKKFINKNNYDKNTSLQHTHYDSDSSDGPFYDCYGDLNQLVEDTSTRISTDCSTTYLCCVTDKSEVYSTIQATALQESECAESNSANIAEPLQNFISNNFQYINKNEVLVPQVQIEVGTFFLDDRDGDNETVCNIPRIRRSSSLKTGKTPPGTPGQKKIVRFADVLGLDLADVRTFLDEIPRIPNSAFNDLLDIDVKPTSQLILNSSLELTENFLVPLFKQPGGQPDFIDRVRDRKVCLDSALIEDFVTLSIKGIVRVKNVDFHKTVHVRYTLDSWQSFADVQATYIENSCDGFSDKFSFLLFANNLALGEKLEFAIRFQCKGCQYWDNNNGINYSFQSLPATNQCSNVTLTLPDS